MDETDDIDPDLPSEIGDDQWGEIPKYWYQKHVEAVNKEKQEMIDKKIIMKQTLDKQV